MKKIISVLMVLAMMTGLLCTMPLTASAATEGDYSYFYVDANLNTVFNESEATGVKIWDYNGSTSTLTIPATLGGKPVVYIESMTFHDCNTLKNVTIPGGVKKIGSSAFSKCSLLEKVTISSGVQEIENGVFRNCVLLNSVSIPSTVKTISSYMFEGAVSLKSIKIPSSITTISDYAFYQTGLTAVTIPNSVKVLGKSAFYDCASLKTVKIGSGVKVIDEYTFRGTAITTLAVPGTVQTINNNAFYNCKKLKTLTIEDGVKTIGKYAFYNCDAVTKITVAKSVTTLGDSAFPYVFKETIPVYCYKGSAAYKWFVAENAGWSTFDPYKISLLDPIKSIKLNKTSATKGVGQTLTLKVTFDPKNTAYKTITWKSSKTSVATVDKNGKVKAIKAGKATITAKTVNGKTAKCVVTVKAKPTKIKLSKSVTLKKGAKYSTSVKFTPSNAHTERTYKSSKPSVAKVDKNGKVTAVKAGTATITVKTYNGKTSKITITVKK